MNRSCLVGLLAGSIGFISAADAADERSCKPALAVAQIHFSEMQPRTMKRTWSAVVSVDASQCATTAGPFEIGFSRQKENGPEIDFGEPFTWLTPSVNVSVDFWADEAVESYWLDNVAACPCRR